MHDTADEHLMQSILGKNEEIAEHNREHFAEYGALVINLMSAPGAGKTTLLEATIPLIKSDNRTCAVIEGDMVGELDANRLRAKGVEVEQISTGRSCHLDAAMVSRLLHHKDYSGIDYLFIENVGNLVCPAEFPLGEHKRVVLLSVTEGDDKPIKYPVIFRQCDAVIFTKCDLLPYVNFDIERATSYVQALNSQAKCFSLSSKSTDGVEKWQAWLKEQRQALLEEPNNVPVGAG